MSDRDQRPLRQALVRVFDDLSPEASWREHETDVDGTCTISWPDPLARLRIDVSREGFAHTREVRQLAQELRFSLAPALVLLGRAVSAEDGAGVVAATVTRPHVACDGCPPDRTTTDEQGRFRLEGVPVGIEAQTLVFQVPDLPAQDVLFSTLGAGSVLQRDFALSSGREITGRVVDLETRLPLAAVVAIPPEEVATDPSGQFRLRALPDRTGAYALAAWSEGTCRMEARLTAEEAAKPVWLALPRGLVVRGAIRDTEGRPVAGASVAAVQVSSAGEGARIQDEPGLPRERRLVRSVENPCLSDEQGLYELHGLPPLPGKVRLQATRAGFRSGRLELDADGEPGEVLVGNVELAPEAASGTITGKLTLNGQTLSARVVWRGATSQGSARAQGSYRLEGVEAGRVQLSVELGDSLRLGSPIPDSAVVLELAPGAELAHDFVLALPLARIAGTVRQESGATMANAMVRYQQTELRVEGERLSDATGRFTFDVPDQGMPYVLSTWNAGEVVRVEDVWPGDEAVELVLPDPGVLRIQVVDGAEGTPIQDVMLAWRRSGETEFRRLDAHAAPLDARGVREIVLPAGSVDLLVRSDALGYQALLARALAVRAEPVPAPERFELRRGITLSCRLDPGSEPWPDGVALYLVEDEVWESLQWIRRGRRISVQVGEPYTPDSIEARRLVLDNDRSVELRGLAAGRYRFKHFPEELVVEPAEVVLEGTSSEPLTIRWRRR